MGNEDKLLDLLYEIAEDTKNPVIELAIMRIERLELEHTLLEEFLRKRNHTGHWVYDKDGNDWGIGAYRCSECGCKNDNLGITKSPFNVMSFAGSKYCPNCGVRMDGGIDKLEE